MSRMSGKNSWALLLLILAGVVLGGFIGYLAQGVPMLSWLNYGQEFGIGGANSNGIIRLNLGVMIISFGLTIKNYHCWYYRCGSGYNNISKALAVMSFFFLGERMNGGK